MINMCKTLLCAVLAVSLMLMAAKASPLTELNGPARKLQTGVAFGPDCSNSYYKSGPGFKPTSKNKPCCTGKGFICATFTGQKPSSKYSSCMTLAACKASNNGALQKSPGWNCKPAPGNGFPQCATFQPQP